MASKKILMICGDYCEDYETMVPFQALLAVGFGEEGFRIEAVAGPVGEALVMTAAGLAVAIPAVLGYNVLGRRIAQIEALLEGFAHDLRALLVPSGVVASAP